MKLLSKRWGQGHCSGHGHNLRKGIICKSLNRPRDKLSIALGLAMVMALGGKWNIILHQLLILSQRHSFKGCHNKGGERRFHGSPTLTKA